MDLKDEKDFDKYKGKLAGKIVFLGDMREVKPVDKPLFTRYDDDGLKKIEEYPVHVGPGFDRRGIYSSRRISAKKSANFSPANKLPLSYFPAATARTTAVPAAPFSTTTAPPSASRSIIAIKPILFPSRSPRLKIMAASTASLRPTYPSASR